MLKIFTRENNSPFCKGKYVFKSENMSVFSQKDVVTRMAQYNTTLTEADALAALNVFKRVVVDLVLQGYVVQTILGLFHAVAGGTADDVLSDFTPGAKGSNHNIRLRFRPAADIIENVQKNTVIGRGSNALKSRANIDVVRNADGNNNFTVLPGDNIFISGDYLKFDKADEKYGVFLVSDEKEIRLNYYSTVSAARIVARVDHTVEPGVYTLVLRNRPNSSDSEVVYKKQIKIS